MKKIKLIGSNCGINLKLDLKMRLTLLLLLVSLFRINASTYSQSKKISLSLNQVDIETVFDEIKSKSEFKIYFKNSELDLKRRVSINIKKKRVEVVLDLLFEDTNIEYIIFDKQIILKLRTEKKRKDFDAVENDESEQRKIEITGSVSDKNGDLLPGVNVVVEGTTTGTQTDFDGNYSIKAEKGATLIFTYIGMKTQKVVVGDAKLITVVLEEAENSLEEVVVTALGIRKEKKRIGFATQEVKGASLQKVQTSNVVESLAGKVAGLTIISNGADFFSDPSIFLRGEKPLVVVDGVPQPNSDFWNLSSDDIDNINVLKGAAASALYGSLGKNGAIQVTMKTGKGTVGTKVSFNSSTTFQGSFLRIPKPQTQYGPGNTGRYQFGTGAAGGGGVNDFDYSVWGPKFDGRLIKQFDSPIDPVTGERIPTPWISRGPDNLKNFMQTGLITSNHISVMSSSEKGSFVISNTYKYSKASTPGQKLDNNILRLTGSLNLSKSISIDASLQYNYQYSNNRIRGSYGPSSPVYLLSIWGGANFDVRNFKHVWVPGKEGIKQDFVENWRYNNPYALAYAWKRPWTKNDILSYIKMNFKLSEKVNGFVRTTLSSNNLVNNDEISKDIYDYSIPDKGGRFRYRNSRYFENNTDILINYKDKFFNEDLGIDANFGANQRFLSDESESAATTQLIVPEVFTLSNSVDKVTPSSSKKSKGVYSVYGSVDFSYKNYLYAGVTGRIDRSSTLVAGNDSFFYPSVYSSLVLSELFELPEQISFLKLRASWAKVGGDLDIYEATNSYSTDRWRNVPTASFPGTLENPNLKPAFNSSYELGFEIKLFNGRFGVDFSYYESTNGPQIYTQDFSSASGYGGIRFNGRETERRGMDFSITGVPIKTENFKWSTIINFDKSKNYLTVLPPLPDGTVPTSEGRTPVGSELGHYWYPVWERSPDGQLIIKENGLPKVTDFRVDTGSTQPDFSASLANTLVYKDFSFSFLLDGRFGGVTQDRYAHDLWRAGGHPDAVHPERELSNIAYINGTDARTMQIDGVAITSGDVTYDPDGNILTDTRVFAPSTYKVDYQKWAGGYKGAWQNQIKEKTFIKLREVALSYRFPSSLLKKTFMNTASVSVIARNLFYWSKDDFYGDLDTYSLSTGDTNLQLPSQRSLGFNFNFTF